MDELDAWVEQLLIAKKARATHVKSKAKKATAPDAGAAKPDNGNNADTRPKARGRANSKIPKASSAEPQNGPSIPAELGLGASEATSQPVVEFGYKGVRPPPFIPNPRTPDNWPKKHAPGAILPGDSVWYGSERSYVVCPPPDWLTTSFVQISSIPVRPGQQIPRDATYLSVHADALETAPMRGTFHDAQPSKHAVETRERKKAEGVTDIGDQVGTLLRGKDLDEAYAICAEYIGIPEDVLRMKYTKLNPGQQRMILGNRMRATLKKTGRA